MKVIESNPSKDMKTETGDGAAREKAVEKGERRRQIS
jgi:hypothetical protein